MVLTEDESIAHRRLGEAERRRLAESDTRALHHLFDPLDPTGKCLVYHCFVGDKRCDEPSGREMCAVWSEADDACAEPMCKAVYPEDDLEDDGETRRQLKG
jgi:hypothetical protein